MSFWYGGTSFEYMPRSGIAGVSGRTIFNFLRNHQIDFQSCCTRLQSHQQWSSVPLSPYPCQHVHFILAILSGVRWNLRVIFICISLITKDFEHFFMPFSVIQDSSVGNSLFIFGPHFKLVLLGLLVFNFLRFI